MQSLAQPLLELGLHFISCHALESLDLLDSVLRGFGFHLFDVTLFFVRATASVVNVALDLQFVFNKLLQRVVISSALIVLAVRIALEEIFNGGI